MAPVPPTEVAKVDVEVVNPPGVPSLTPLDPADVIYCGPVTKPLFHLQQLLEWVPPATEVPNDGVPNDETHYFHIPKLLPRESPLAENTGPLTLVCHDMKGGYIEDRYNAGHLNCHSYRYSHWSMIDIFIYFSHHLVTIPPIGWTIAAHNNGVKCFGTLIIEHWNCYDLEADPNLEKRGTPEEALNEFLLDEGRVDAITTVLANIAAYYHFDGWLVNAEAGLAIEKIPLMEAFLRSLTAKVKTARGLAPNDIAVLWYDAVTCDTGTLEWQNELNSRNIKFFRACDGIFLNYCWSPKHLQRSKAILLNGGLDLAPGAYGDDEEEILPEEVIRAQADPTIPLNRIFAGLDVFGRGCLGGGGFFSHIAMQEIRKVTGLSAAIFAPGWTYEVMGQENFETNEHRFWSNIHPYTIERAVVSLPLKTTFCQGIGDRIFRKGTQIATHPWFNLREQQLQPSFHSNLLSIHKGDAWNGGSSLKMTFALPRVTLFHCAIPLTKTEYTYTMTYKMSHAQALSLLSQITLLGGDDRKYELDLDSSEEKVIIPEAYSSLIKDITLDKVDLANGWSRDIFQVLLHPNLPANLQITQLKAALRRNFPGQSMHIAVDTEDKFVEPHVLLGELTLE